MSNDEPIIVPAISDDRLICAWVTAMHCWIATGAEEWEFQRQMLEAELLERKLGRKRLFLKFDQAAWEAEEANGN